VPLLTDAVGMQPSLKIHKYGPEEESIPLVYIQGSLHADELPGIMVNHHLLKMLDVVSEAGWMAKRVHVVPYANPYGLYQTILSNKQGRFSIASGTNFNRSYADVTEKILAKGVLSNLQAGNDPETMVRNTKIIRQAIREEHELLMAKPDITCEAHWKLELLRRSSQADLVLDLHCDSHALLYMYGHANLWPQLKDLASELGCIPILDDSIGGSCFDEASAGVFYQLRAKCVAQADKYPKVVVPMACESVTVELRGELDASDENASQDAAAIFRVLQRRGYIDSAGADGSAEDVAAAEAMLVEKNLLPSASVSATAMPLPDLCREPLSLRAVDFMTSTAGGVITWKVNIGDWVERGQLLGEIVNVEVSAQEQK
jgi:uncharacterized protein